MMNIGLAVVAVGVTEVLCAIPGVISMVSDGITGKMPKWLAFPGALVKILELVLICCGVVK